MAIVDITKIRLLRGLSSDLPSHLDDAELAFTTDDGRLFVGYSGDPEIASRGTYPYSNLEILTENATDLFAEMHGARMKEGGGSDYYSAVLNQSNKSWQAVQVLRDGTWFNYAIAEIDNVTAFLDYAIYTNAGETIRLGHSTIRHYDSNEAEPFLEDGIVAGRDLDALLQLEPPQVFQRVDLRFRVAGPLNAPYLLFEYRNPLAQAVNLRFKVSRPKIPYYDQSTDKKLEGTCNVLVKVIATIVGSVPFASNSTIPIPITMLAQGITSTYALVVVSSNTVGLVIPTSAAAAQVVVNMSAAATFTPPISLSPLTLSSTTLIVGTPSNGTINGATVGSAITSSALPAGYTIDGAARTWAWDGTGTASEPILSLTQTLAGAIGSPSNNLFQLSIEGSGTAAFSPHELRASSTQYGDQTTSALAGIRIQGSQLEGIINEDDITTNWYNLQTWLLDGSTSNWSIRATLTDSTDAGSFLANGTYGTWITATSNPQWDVAAYTNEFQRTASVQRTFTLEAALTSNTSVVLATATMILGATSRTLAGDIP